METIRVLLVDDHALFRSGVAGLLRDEPGFEVVGEASDGEEGITKALELMPDIILMDVYMPGINGLEATKAIKKKLPYVKIIMLTVSAEDKDLFEAIKAGAQGYLYKKMDPPEFLRVLQGTIRGEAPISRATAGKILGEFSRMARHKGEGPDEDKLSPREIEVLQLIATGDTNRAIGESLFISENTVKNHLKNILEKLHLKNRVQAATFAIRSGLLDDEDD